MVQSQIIAWHTNLIGSQPRYRACYRPLQFLEVALSLEHNTVLTGCTYGRGLLPNSNLQWRLETFLSGLGIFLKVIKVDESSLTDYCTYFVAYSDGSCTDTL